jgi:hypothetical protein
LVITRSDLARIFVRPLPLGSNRGVSMQSRPGRLLCVGKELDSVQIRGAVLESAAYEATSATVAEAVKFLRTEEFDLVIISA